MAKAPQRPDAGQALPLRHGEGAPDPQGRDASPQPPQPPQPPGQPGWSPPGPAGGPRGVSGPHDRTRCRHWVQWPEHWELQALQQAAPPPPADSVRLFYPTRVTAVDLRTGEHHHWQSRTNRKCVRHHPHGRPRPGPWCRWVFCWKPTLFAWYNALGFLIGSTFWMIDACTIIKPSYAADTGIALAMGKIGLCGAVFFFVGGTAQVLEVYQAPMEVSDPSWETLVHDAALRQGRKGGGSATASPASSDRLSQAPSPRRDGAAADGVTAIAQVKCQAQARHGGAKSGLLVTVADAEGAGSGGGEGERPRKKPCTGFDVLRDRGLPLWERLYVVFGQWRRIDAWLAWIQFVGVTLFIVNTLAVVGWWMRPSSPSDPVLFWGINIVPDIVASCTFVIAGWLQVVEASHRWWGGWQPCNIGWHAGWNNTIGGLGFLANALAFRYLQNSMTSTLLLLIGSAFFWLGSLFMWLELCWD